MPACRRCPASVSLCRSSTPFGPRALVDQRQARNNRIRRNQGTWCNDCVCPDTASVSDQSAELVHTCINHTAAMLYSNGLVVQFVPVIGNNGAGLNVDVTADERVANKTEVRKLSVGKQKRALEFT